MSKDEKRDDLIENGKIDLTENNEESAKLNDLRQLEEEKISDTLEDENKQEEDELTDEQKRELYIKALKESRIRFRNTVHDGNITHTKFGKKYKKKRKKRNRLAKHSRQMNRK